MMDTKTYLLLWNCKPEFYPELHKDYEDWKINKWLGTWWATGAFKTIPDGARVFVMRVGDEPKGIIAAGKTRSVWIETDEGNGNKVAFNLFVPPDEPLLSLKLLRGIHDSEGGRYWLPMAAKTIHHHIAEKLEEKWSEAAAQAGLTIRDYPDAVPPD